MFPRNYKGLPILVILLCLSNSLIYIADSYEQAVATWYGVPTGSGKNGNGCGFGDDVEDNPYEGFIAAGSDPLFKSESGCGTCYEVMCTEHPSCLGEPIKITITDHYSGEDSRDAIHFDLTGRAFGALAKRGEADNLRNAGKINIQFQRIRCFHPANIDFKIDEASSGVELILVIENVNGDGNIGRVELLPATPGSSLVPMQHYFGAVWKVDIRGLATPYSFILTAQENSTPIIAIDVIPTGWEYGKHYYSNINFPI